MPLTVRVRRLVALSFSVLFFALSVTLAGIAVAQFAGSFTGEKGLAEGLLKALNMAVIALATFELGLGVHKEYAAHDQDDDILRVLRRTVSRFVSIVCIALVLESLIMVIKYSQLELAGNLPYPVAILASAAVLLLSLGAFLRWTRGTGEDVGGCPTDRTPRVLLPQGAVDAARPQLVRAGAREGAEPPR